MQIEVETHPFCDSFFNIFYDWERSRLIYMCCVVTTQVLKVYSILFSC